MSLLPLGRPHGCWCNVWKGVVGMMLGIGKGRKVKKAEGILIGSDPSR